MTEKFIAIAPKGQEFMYRRTSMIAVPTASAKKIADALNNLKYELKDGETWHIYDNDSYKDAFIDKAIRRYSKDALKVYRY